MPAPALSIRTRALLAVVLLVGFYALALAMAGTLLWIPYGIWTGTERVSWGLGKIALFCGIGAFLIVKGILPRPDRFEAPGPELTAQEYPDLFEMIGDVAKATGQAPPAEVYLVADVNAWVSQRGGVMGFGSRRVMGIGLPLMELLTLEELRAVVAHEFGHYVSGDTSLGPWIYRTRVAIGRTLDEVSGHSTWLAKPFEWYGAGFLRVTHAVSRAQEFVADATAAQVAGRDAMRRALVKIAGASGAFASYWQSELAPTLELGYRPPLAHGFRQFLTSPTIAPRVAELVDAELASTATDPYDTHPNLRDRLGALERLAKGTPLVRGTADADEAHALSLLGDVDAAEAILIASLAHDAKAPPLAPVTWDDVPGMVLPVGWRQAVEPAARALAGLTVEQLPAVAKDHRALAVRLQLAPSLDRLEDHHPMWACAIVGAALSLALLRHLQATPGTLRLEAPPGEPVRFVCDTEAAELLPFAVCERFADGSLGADEWARACAAFGIAGVDLGAGLALPPLVAKGVLDFG